MLLVKKDSAPIARRCWLNRLFYNYVDFKSVILKQELKLIKQAKRSIVPVINLCSVFKAPWQCSSCGAGLSRSAGGFFRGLSVGSEAPSRLISRSLE